MIAAGKLIFSIGLVLLGWKVYGIITALLLGTGIAIVYGVHYMKNISCTETKSLQDMALI